LRDGCLINVPEDNVLPAVDKNRVETGLKQRTEVLVYLGLPVYNPGRANVAAADAPGDGAARWSLDNPPMVDENTGGNDQRIKVRVPNLKLLLGTEDLAGYDVVPIARIKRSARAEAVPELDRNYIPPVLACDAWKPLAHGIIQEIVNRLGQLIESQSALVISRGVSLQSQAGNDIETLVQLRIVNEAYALLWVLAGAEGIHPLHAYLELCRLVGQLAILDRHARKPPELLKYDHDDLGTCFYRVRQYIDAYLDQIGVVVYKERPFEGRGLQMQVTIDRDWLGPAYHMYIGVASPLSDEECKQLLSPRGLDMKVGSSDKVDELFMRGIPGLNFELTTRPPSALPKGWAYFQINRDVNPTQWSSVDLTGKLAIRLNENLIAGRIDGQRELTIRRPSGESLTLKLMLFVLPLERPRPAAP
jgi:type VI secretion system protein ImpJ